MRGETSFIDRAAQSLISKQIRVVSRVVSIGYVSWQSLKHNYFWSIRRNPPSRQLIKTHSPTLSETQRKVVQDLEAEGIAFVAFDALGVNPQQWDALRKMVSDYTTAVATLLSQNDKTQLAAITDLGPLEHNREKLKRFVSDKGRGDDYLFKLYPEGPTLDLSNPLLQIALDGSVLDVINVYMGLWSKITYTDVWHTLPIPVGRRVGSQKWHRDPEDKKMVKVYLYLADVDKGAGPLEYVRGSTIGKKYGHLWPYRPSGHYPPEGQVEQKIPSSEFVLGTGSTGTMIFCDTSGLHRGGIATTGARIVATWTFVTPASLYWRRFKVTENNSNGKSSLSDAAKYALTDPA
jgi:hypothetical protein